MKNKRSRECKVLGVLKMMVLIKDTKVYKGWQNYLYKLFNREMLDISQYSEQRGRGATKLYALLSYQQRGD